MRKQQTLGNLIILIFMAILMIGGTVGCAVDQEPASTDATLADLTVSEGTLDPVFDASTTAYTVSLDYDVESITVTGTASDAGATLNGDSGTEKELDVGEYDITITDTAEDGTTTEAYTVTVTRNAASTDAALSSLTVSEGTLDPAFSASTTTYTVSVENDVENITVTGTAADAGATLSGDSGVSQSLEVGENDITITVTAEDGTTTTGYTVTVTRKDSVITPVPMKTFNGSGGEGLGSSASLSSDGSIALVSAPYHTDTETQQGCAYIYTREGSEWTQKAKLMPESDDIFWGQDTFGHAVSLSSDGQTALIGKLNDNARGQGAAYVFKTTDNWTTSSSVKLVPEERDGTYRFGFAVSISSDGKTALINEASRAYIFVEDGTGGWDEQAVLASTTAESYPTNKTVSLSGDGNTAMIGRERDNYTVGESSIEYAGTVYIYSRSDETWSLQSTLNISEPEIYDSLEPDATLNFGADVKLSYDGNAALIKAADGTHVYSRSSSVWAETEIIDKIGAISLNPDGDLALIGNQFYRYTGSSWEEKISSKFFPAANTNAISSDGAYGILADDSYGSWWGKADFYSFE